MRSSPTITTGPRPSAGVGGTREGVKCLHAHYANYLVNGGRSGRRSGSTIGWRQVGKAFDPSKPGIISTWDQAE